MGVQLVEERIFLKENQQQHRLVGAVENTVCDSRILDHRQHIAQGFKISERAVNEYSSVADHRQTTANRFDHRSGDQFQELVEIDSLEGDDNSKSIDNNIIRRIARKYKDSWAVM